MIKIENLNLKFDDNVIFKNENIIIPDNKITMVVGPNGTGKTSLLRVISGDIKANCNIENTFKKIFYLPQKLYYPKGISTYDYVASIFFKNHWKWFLDKAENDSVLDVLNQLDLLKRKDVLIDNISTGELQKANIALGLLSNADLFLLDEPTSNMDLVNQIKILDIIKNLLNLGKTVVIIMHDINLSSSYGDYFIGLSSEHKVISAEKNDFFKAEILKEIYNIDFKVVNNEEKFYIQIFN